MKNLKRDIFKLGRFVGFAFSLTDLTPAERLIWDDNTPDADQGGRRRALRPRGARPARERAGAGADGRLAAGHEARLAAGRRLARRRRPGRAARRRAAGVRAARARCRTSTRTTSRAPTRRSPRSTRRCSTSSASRAACSRRQLRARALRARRGGPRIACQDLYTHPPGKHEGALVNTYRVALERFGDERPKLTFIEPPEED